MSSPTGKNHVIKVFARFSEAHLRINPNRQQLLFAGEPVGKALPPCAARHKPKLEAAAVTYFDGFQSRLGFTDRDVGEGYCWSSFGDIPTPPKFIPTIFSSTSGSGWTVPASLRVNLFENQVFPVFFGHSWRVLWCPGEDSNLHSFHYWYLKPARLPIPPPGQRGSLRAAGTPLSMRLRPKSSRRPVKS